MVTQSPFLKNLSQNHQFQGQTNNCGPFCTAMVINTIHDSQLTGQQVAEKLNDPRQKPWYQPLRRIPDSATFPWGITAYLADHGINAQWRMFVPIIQLADYLNQGKLIIILTASIPHFSAHYRILVSIETQMLGFVDPAWSDGEIQYQPKEKFLTGWANSLHSIILIDP